MSSFDELMAGISDEVLVAKAREWADRLEADGGSYRMCVPAHWDDPDIVFSELADRYGERHDDKELVMMVRQVEYCLRKNIDGCRQNALTIRVYMGNIRAMCNQFFI